LFDAVTALSGCGPGFLFRFIEAMAEGGALHWDLPADQALRLATATVKGSGHCSPRQSDESPAVLADRVASPGGSHAGRAQRARSTMAPSRRCSGRRWPHRPKRNAELAAAARG
jgi:pyrroline-5-carboxylate reductase